MWKKVIATAMALAMIITVCSTSINCTKAAPEDGDICTNPWEELFTGDPGDLEVPSQETTTKDKEVTTPKNTSSEIIKPSKGRVISATRKSKKAKKAKLTIKKVKGANGYQIQISASKKFRKILVKKNIRKLKVTITSKNLKNKKKLYVRVKAYKLNGKTKVWGKWSNKKVIKVKKKK